MADTAETSVVAALILNIENFVRGITEDAPKAIDEGMRRMQSSVTDGVSGIEGKMREAGSRGGKGFVDGLLLTAGAGAIAFLEQVRSQLERGMQFAHEMTVLRIETGESFSQLQRLQYAFAGVGVSSDRARMLFAQFNYQIENAAALGKGRSILERMGLDPKQMQTQTVTQNIEAVADKIRQYNSVAQTAIARGLFGRTGMELLPLLTQGKQGIETLGAGAGTDADLAKVDAVITKMDELHNKFMQIAIQMQSAWMLMLDPIVNLLLRVVDGVNEIIVAFQRLSEQAKSDLLFGALTSGLLLSADLLAAIRPLFSNLIGREVLQGLSQFVIALHGLVIVGALLYGAWRTDFGGIREAAVPVIDAVRTALQNFHEFIVGVSASVRSILTPAFADFSNSMKPVFQEFAFVLAQAMSSKGIWAGLASIITTVAQAFAVLMHALAQQGISNAAQQFIGFIGNLLSSKEIFAGIGAAIGIVVTAFEALIDIGNVLQQVFSDIFAVLNAILDPADAFKSSTDSMRDSVETFNDRMKDTKQAIQQGFQWALDHKGELEAFFVVLIGGRAITAVSALVVALRTLGATSAIVTGIGALRGAFDFLLAILSAEKWVGFAGILGVIRAAIMSLIGPTIAWVVALGPVTLICIGIAAVIALVILAITHWKDVLHFLQVAWEDVMAAIGHFLEAAADFNRVLLGWIPGIDTLANHVHALGQSFIDAADAHRKFREEQEQKAAQAAAPGPVTDTSESHFRNQEADSEAAYKKKLAADAAARKKGPPTGTESLPPPPATATGTASTLARENIERIKQSLEQYDDAVKDADLHVRGLQSQIESLGKIDTADKLTKAERLYKEEVTAVNVLHHDREIQLHAEQRAAAELHSLDVSAERVARANPKNKEDQTIARDYHSAWREAHTKVHELQVQTIDDQTKVNKLQQDSVRLAVDYYNALSADTSTTFDARTAALQTELTILQKHNENLVEQHKLMRDIVALDNERIAAEEKTGPQVTTQLAIDQVTRQADLLAVGIHAPTKPPPGMTKPEEFGPHGTKTAEDQVALQKTHLELQLAVLRAEAALEVFSRTLTTEFGGQLSDNAKAAFKSLVDAMRNGAAPEQLSALLNSFINAVPPAVRNTGEFSAALEKLLPTINTQTTATTAVDVAQQKLADDINKTSERVQSVREQFDNLAKETAGPLYDLFTGLAGNGANLVTSFIDLFKQTLAYKDIQIVMAAITKTLAQVFEALRPIIDLLLGVLIGVVDMFIFLINMMISFLNIFGLHIQHLKTVNDILKDLGNNAKPLLQITHDLPTFNEYNAGKWADLRAQQQANANDLNSLLHNGFNKTFGQLGQIIGTLLAIKVLLTLMSAGGLNGMGGGGIFGFLGKLLGFGGGGGAFLPASDVGIGGVASFGGAPLAGMADAVSSGDLASAVSDGVVQGMSQNAETNAMLAAQGNATQDAIAANTERTASALDGTTTTTGSVVDHLGNIVKYVRGFGDVLAIAGGYKAGGIGGGISAGIGAEQLAVLLGATGPVGILAGAVVGLGALLFGGGGLFGHKSNSRDNPDMFPNTNWGQDNANLRGSGLNGAPTFHSQVGGNYSAQTGMDMGYLQYIGTWIAQNQAKAKQVLGNLVNIFQGENVGNPIKGGKNGFLDLVNGVHLYFSDLYNDAMQAVRDITGGGGVGDPGSLAALFAGAGNLNLATLFGTGGAYAIPGGYGITGGVPTTLPNTGNNSLPGVTQPPSNSQSIVINIEHVHGSTTSEIQRAFGPVIDDLAEMLSRRQQLYTRASENTVGRI